MVLSLEIPESDSTLYDCLSSYTNKTTLDADNLWTCDKCNHVHSSWTAICDRCSGFDTLAWKTPAEGAIAMHGSSQMLPLIVGQEKVVEPEQEVVDAEEVITGEIVSDDVKP